MVTLSGRSVTIAGNAGTPQPASPIVILAKIGPADLVALVRDRARLEEIE
jgi:hypothetical protein